MAIFDSLFLRKAVSTQVVATKPPKTALLKGRICFYPLLLFQFEIDYNRRAIFSDLKISTQDLSKC